MSFCYQNKLIYNSQNVFYFSAYCIPPPRTMSKIVWMDMEMSGLNVEKERILEIACLITNNNLDILAECPTIILHQSEKVLKDMDEWNTSTHAKVSTIFLCS